MWNGHKHTCEDVVIIYANLDSIWSFFSDIYFYYLYRERFEVNLHAKRWENVKWFNVAEEQVFSLFSSEDERKMSIPREFLKTNFKNFDFLLTNSWTISWAIDVFQKDFPVEFEFVVRCHCRFLFLTHSVNGFYLLNSKKLDLVRTAGCSLFMALLEH